MSAFSLKHRWMVLAFLSLLRIAAAQDDFLDAVDDHLKFSACNGDVRVRLSGLLDMEGYYVEQPPPSLIQTSQNYLLNPRLTLFLDAQLGEQFYLFAQTRVDRGFDPGDEEVTARLDEYALRYTPFSDECFNLQVGKFATAVGNWTQRHDSWENPFVTAPLPYENLTSVWDVVAAYSAGTLNSWITSDKSLRIPIIWGPSYTSGLSAFGHVEQFDYAAEIKNAPISSRPGYWDGTSLGWENPTFDGRFGWRPDEAWNFGVSGSVGPYLVPEGVITLPKGKGIDDYREILLAQDASFAWHHWQVWAEVFETRFQVPNVSNADTLAYYVEAKYKFTPQFFGALRWNQQLFADMPGSSGGNVDWDGDAWRADAALTYRFTTHLQAKLQYSFLHQELSTQEDQHLIAAQVTVRF